MNSDDVVDPAEATQVPGRRRGRWIPLTLVVALLVGVAAWQGAARIGRIDTGPAAISGGLDLPDCIPQDDYWTSFGTDEEVVVAHTLRNPSPWSVTVISTDPEVYRFEPLSEDPSGDDTFAAGDAGSPPEGTQSSVVVPPDRSVVMWIHNPQGNIVSGSSVRYSFDGVRLKVRSLGVEREVYVPYQGTLYVGGGSRSSEELSAALAEACSG
ncbi:hypothetical protein ACQEVI_09670 [Promicromonospora sp. CA-289599]|uniref:hypothetical protein n=1 Tax=Promicromonospora sp. CA-289599 TaxID=3240014 RepID=UPI003D8FF6B9